MIYDTIIVGAGPSGLSASIYLKNANKKVLVLEKNVPGGKILKANKITNYLGFNEEDPSDLAYKMYDQTVKLDVELKIESVLDINIDDNIKIVTTNKDKYRAKSIIIACGRIEKNLGIKGENSKNVSYCAKCDGSLYKDKVVALIGNNSEAISDALYLSNIVKKLIYINYSDNEVTFNNENICVINNKKINEIISINDVANTIVLSNNEKYKIDGIFLETGYTPNIDFIKSLNIKTESNYIVVDENMKTNIDGIYAVGDIIKKDIYQIITSAAEGTKAALSIIKEIK